MLLQSILKERLAKLQHLALQPRAIALDKTHVTPESRR